MIPCPYFTLMPLADQNRQDVKELEMSLKKTTTKSLDLMNNPLSISHGRQSAQQ